MEKLRLPKNLGMTWGVWLIITGLIPLLHFNFQGLPVAWRSSPLRPVL